MGKIRKNPEISTSNLYLKIWVFFIIFIIWNQNWVKVDLPCEKDQISSISWEFFWWIFVSWDSQKELEFAPQLLTNIHLNRFIITLMSYGSSELKNLKNRSIFLQTVSFSWVSIGLWLAGLTVLWIIQLKPLFF